MEPTESEPIRVDAGGWGLTWAVDRAGRLRQLGLGPAGAEASAELPAHLYPEAFPTLGTGDPFRPPPLAVTHADGMLTTRLVVDAVARTPVARTPVARTPVARTAVARTPVDGDDGGGEHVVVTCRDEIQPLTVELHLRTHPASGVLEQWVEIVHAEPGPVRLEAYDSIGPTLLVTADATLDQFGGGGWADEWRWTTESLTPGTKELASLGGVQPHLQRNPCALVAPAGPAGEDAGEVVAVSVAWGGNVHVGLDVRPKPDLDGVAELRIRAGANPLGAPYVLDPGVRFVTPTVAWTWATGGRDEVTRRFHAWTRARVLRDPDRSRGIVANNWEATYFDFDEARVVDLIGRAADLGADVFLLDDGWFGGERPRDDDTTSLGDWDPDPRKLPRGLAPLADAAAAAGIRFGIWVEPEMVNPVSALHDHHPDWVVRDGREPRLHRNQLVLDPLLPEVRAFEVDVVDRTLASAPGTSYVKWDANRPVTDPGSRALPADRQANLWVDQVHATWEVMAEVARRHPDVDLMLCASGGGRTDHGTLRWFHEVWTSDNTDPVTRVRMQWACSHFFPASVMAAHVTRWGDRPLSFACAVALSGRFGFDLDLAALTEEERAVCRRAVALARRTQDVVQHGVVRRLVSPVSGADRSRAAWAVTGGAPGDAPVGRAPGSDVGSDGGSGVDSTVLFAYQLDPPGDAVDGGPALRLRWLDPDRAYEVVAHDLDRSEPNVEVRSGASLAADGIDWPLTGPCEALVYEIRPT
ncbi:MAG: melibiase [Acidimicrobiales bacterium]|nr:melibiase [Acidimicrobiales bacterium]